MSVTPTNDTKVEGSIVAVMHVTYDDTAAEWQRTVLALANKDDLSVSVDEDDEDFDAAIRRRTQRHRTNNTIDVEVTSAVSPEVEELELVGIANVDGEFETSTDARKIREADNEYVEIAYFNFEPDFETVDIVADSELLHRFADCEATNPGFNPDGTPITFEWTWWVDGMFTIAATGDPPAP